MTNLDIAERYIALLNDPESTPDQLGELLAPDLVQTALPNLLSARGGSRDRSAVLLAFARGKEMMARQTLTVRNKLADGDRVALEMEWEGTLAQDVGDMPAGSTLRADVAVFLELRDGLIVSQRNYDCYHAHD